MAPQVVAPQAADLIPLIYDTLLDQASWSTVLDTLTSVVAPIGLTVMATDDTAPLADIVVQSAAYRAQPDLLEKFAAEALEEDSQSYRALRQYPPGSIIADTEAFGDVSNGPPDFVGKWLLEHLGVARRFAVSLHAEPPFGAFLIAHFGRTHLASGLECMDPFRPLIPQLAKVMEIARPFRVLHARFAAVLSALDRFQVGVIIVDPRGHLVVHNRSAAEILDRSDGPCVTAAGRLGATSPDVADALAAAVTEASGIAAAGGAAPGTLMPIARGTDTQPYLLEISPLHSGTPGELGHFAGALVLVTEPALGPVLSHRAVEQLYGLTGAESDVCRLLLDGLDTSAVAETRGTSSATARSQVKAVLHKVGVPSRTHLVRRAAALSLPIDDPTPTT